MWKRGALCKTQALGELLEKILKVRLMVCELQATRDRLVRRKGESITVAPAEHNSLVVVNGFIAEGVVVLKYFDPRQWS